MARLSTAGAPVTPERTSEESETRSTDEAGAMATSNMSPDTRKGAERSNGTPNSNTSRIDAMGQNESREVLQERNAAIRRAGKQALKPKPGKLPRRSGPGSQAVARQRKLGTSALANANTYDFPSDNEPAPRPERPAHTAPFSPLMRQMRKQQEQRQQREGEENEEDEEQQQQVQRHVQPHSPAENWRKNEQARIDEQFEQERIRAAQAIAHIRRKSQPNLKDDNAIEQNGGAVDQEEPRELPTSEVTTPKGDDSTSNVNAAETDTPIDVLHDLTTAPSPQREVPKRKRGRPSKESQADDQRAKKRAQPSRLAAGQSSMQDHQAATQRSTPRQTHNDTGVRKKRGRPSKAAVVQREADVPDVPEDDNIQVMTKSGESSKSAAGHVENNAQRQALPVASERRLRSTRSTQAGDAGPSTADLQSEARTQANSRSNDGPSSPPAITENIDNQEDDHVDSPEIINPAQLDNINDTEHNDQAQHIEEVGEGDGSDTADDEEPTDDDDDDEQQVDETEVQVEPAFTDRHRLYGQWPKIQEIMSEVARHRASIVRIRDEEFKEVLRACRDAVRDTTASDSPNQLGQTIAQCQSVITRAAVICSNPDALENSKAKKKRGWHIFKHLLPTLARLLRAAVKAFERTDVEDMETEQITLPHLLMILGLSQAVSEIGMTAYHGFKDLSRPIKRDVHERITVPIRILHTDLQAQYAALVQAQERRRRDEELARELRAMDERREHQAKRRQLELRNQEKWKRMNQVRLALCSNSGNVKKQNHMRSCGMQLVETDADGQPYLPTRLREKRGDWSMREIVALQESLKKHVDNPDPLRSMVFESLIAEQCPFRKNLTEKNLLEIVIKANELKNFYTKQSRDRGTAVAEWVTLIPRWMDPPAAAHDDGTSAEDGIEIE